MKKTIYLLLLLTIIVSFTNPVSMVEAAPLSEESTFTFSDLGLVGDMVLNGPFDAGSLRFDIPGTWLLQGGAELELVISSYFAGENGSTATDTDFLGAALNVYFNDKLQESVSLRVGNDLVYRIPISAADLTSPYSEGWFKISFFLDAAIDCDFTFHQTTVAIDVNSRVILPYKVVPLALDLHRLPWPFYQERINTISPAVIVVPSSASADEIRAALIVMGTLGRMSDGRLPVSMVTTDEFTEDLRNQSNLIIIGKPATLPLLSAVQLPIAITGDRYSSSELNNEDGLLQMGVSPWNKDKAVLVVSGNTDAGVVKAAQALSTNNIQTGNDPTYSLVAEVNPITLTGILSADSTALAQPDITFADLGYEAITVSDIGTNWFSYDFVLPPGQVPTETPNLNLVFSHSALIDADRSDISVYFNDTLAGSIKLSDEEQNLLSSQIKLPLSGLQPGLNDISISANLIPRDDCSISSFSGLWMTVYPESSLHMPLAKSPITGYALQDLNSYPFPFVNDPTLGSTFFVLPSQDHTAWAIAGNLAYDLGRNSTGSILNMGSAFDGELPEDVHSRDLIMVGLPSNLQILSELKEAMPAYFEEGSNVAIIKSQQVIYRITTGKDLGYLELFASPWDPQRAVLGVLGTTTNGMHLAGTALLDSRNREVLNGDFATVDGERPLVVDTRTGSGMGRIVTEIGSSDILVERDPVVTIAENRTANASAGKPIILIGLIGTVILMIGVVVVAFALRKRSL